MRITETAVYKAADKAIDDALCSRNSLSGDFSYDVEFGVPLYIRRLCEQLHAIIGRDDVSLRDVVAADTCASGHVDYQRKFALYCAELAEHGKVVGRL